MLVFLIRLLTSHIGQHSELSGKKYNSMSLGGLTLNGSHGNFESKSSALVMQ